MSGSRYFDTSFRDSLFTQDRKVDDDPGSLFSNHTASTWNRNRCHKLFFFSYFSCNVMTLSPSMMLLSVVLLLLLKISLVASAKAKNSEKSLLDLEYREYPRRTDEEAAVLEWGNSAIISALDASVAHFGPQTTQAALLEVEAMPVLASPINGVQESDDQGEDEETEESEDVAEKPKHKAKLIKKLENADEVHGNMVVMTNMGKELTGVELAKIAQESGAAALLVVNVDEERPEDIYRLPATEGADEIQIPVVMISLNSANVLTTATVTPEMKRRDIVNNGMPERVRLYAGGDRPFFEDVEAASPTVYLIHNLLTSDECQSLIEKASSKVTPITKNDALQLTPDKDKFERVERVVLWQGLLHSPAKKQIEDRIEQVTGFPTSHFSDFVVDRLERGSHWKPKYDIYGTSIVPMASITVFLSDPHPEGGGEFVFPSTQSDPIKIKPRRGLAVVHHNTDENQQFDVNTIHALLPAMGTTYVARKYIYASPVSNSRRIVLPLVALPFGGKLPEIVVRLHDIMVDSFGLDQGEYLFDKVCVFVPCLLVLLLVQIAVDYVQRKMKETTTTKKKKDN